MQRPGKYQKAVKAPVTNDMTLVMFVRHAKEALESAGYEDPAFYFEQIEDWIRAGKSIPSSRKEVEKVLGL